MRRKGYIKILIVLSMVLQKRFAVVTGGSRGIGFEITRKLISEGYYAAICSRNKKELDSAVKKLGKNCFGFVCDVSDSKEIEKFVRKVVSKFGKVDVLVNNAGVIVWGSFRNNSYKDVEFQTRVNLEGLMKVTLGFLPFMRGTVINISSGAGKTPHAGLTVYCATKFGVRGFTQTLALEEKKIKFYSVNPGPTATKMTGFRGLSPEKVAEVVFNTIEGKYKVESGGDVDVWKAA